MTSDIKETRNFDEMTAAEANDYSMNIMPKERGWPPGVKPITIDELDLIGLHEVTKQIHYDGVPMVTQHMLGRREYFLASLVAWATVATAVIAFAALITAWLGSA